MLTYEQTNEPRTWALEISANDQPVLNGRPHGTLVEVLAQAKGLQDALLPMKPAGAFQITVAEPTTGEVFFRFRQAVVNKCASSAVDASPAVSAV